jgi:hypothetical protein
MTGEELYYRSVKAAPVADAVHLIQWGFGVSVGLVLAMVVVLLWRRFCD